jgi:CHAT domain-containing protein/tetratricopeptide (TPR) repeat protein
MHHPNFPSDETLAEFIDGRLAEPERTRVMEHINTCDDCRFVYSVSTDAVANGAGAAVVEGGGNVVRPRFGASRKQVYAAIAVAAVLVLVFGIVPAKRWYEDRTAGIPAVAAEWKHLESRPFEARPAFASAHRPYSANRSAQGREGTGIEPSRFNLIEATAERRAQDDPSRRRLHNAGVAYLANKKFGKAVAMLERALEKETGESLPGLALAQSQDSALLNDLAAAYLARARATDTAEDINLAMSAAERAAEVDPSSLAAAFNRAFSLELLPATRKDAIEAWGDYIRRETDPAWREEAQGRLDNLLAVPIGASASIVEPFTKAAYAGDVNAVRAFATDALAIVQDQGQRVLPAMWASKTLHGDAAAAEQTLVAIETIGEALVDTAEDRYVADIAGAMRRATRDARQEELAAVHSRLGRASIAATVDKDRAIAEWGIVAGEFAVFGSPLTLDAVYKIAATLTGQQRFAECLDELDRARSVLDEHYVAQTCRHGQLRGTALLATGRPAESMTIYRHLLTLAQHSGNRSLIAEIHRKVAENCEWTGDVQRGWQHRLAGMREAAASGNAHELKASLASWTRNAAPNYPIAARVLLQSQAAVATAPAELVETHLWRGVAESRLGNQPVARRALQAAEEAVAKIVDGRERERMSANVSFASAMHVGEADGAGALDRALEFARKTNTHFRVAPIMLARARIAAGDGRIADARAGYRAGVDELIEQSSSARNDAVIQDSLIETYGDLFDDFLTVELDQGFVDEAFRYAAIRRSGGTVIDNTPRLPPGSVLIEYLVLPRKLVTRVSAGGRKPMVITTQVGRKALSENVRVLLDAIERGDDPTVAIETLHDALIAPVRTEVKSAKTLLISADPPLSSVPYGILHGRDESTYLIERVPIRFFLQGQGSAVGSARSAEPRSVLIIADPRLPSEEDGGYPPLPGAAREAAQIAALYPTTTLVTGKEATAARFIEELPRHDIVHVATHALLNDRQPLFSALLFGEDSGTLASAPVYSHVIAGANLANVDVVVLAGCETGRNAADRRYPQAIALGFLRAGVSSVVASLIAIDDDAIGAVLVALHRELAAGVEPAIALQRAQRAQLARDRSPQGLKRWAPLQVITSRS